jgi:formiminoglutamase
MIGREPDMSVWTGRTDPEEGPRAMRWHQVIRPVGTAGPPGVALIGFACDEGVRRNQGRIGARKGPRALRARLANLAAHLTRPLYDAGDEECPPGTLERAQAAFGERVAGLLDRGHFPIGLGGGHEIAFGTFSGLAAHVKKKSDGAAQIGIVNLDAHFDLRQAAQSNSGTSFLRCAEFSRANGWPFHYCCLGVAESSNTAALFDRAGELGVVWRADDDMSAADLPETKEMLHRFISSVDCVYLSVCLDVLPASVAPGVSAPAARGVALEVIEILVDEVRNSGRLAVADIAELNPDFDTDERTAKVAARLVYRLAR